VPCGPVWLAAGCIVLCGNVNRVIQLVFNFRMCVIHKENSSSNEVNEKARKKKKKNTWDKYNFSYIIIRNCLDDLPKKKIYSLRSDLRDFNSTTRYNQ
jgi:hypothetical protein